MRILLFDWRSGGHHELYIRRFAEVLHAHADVVAAVPESSADRLGDAPLEILSLGTARPAVDTSRHFNAATRRAGRREVDLFRRAVRDSGAQLAVHLFADGIVRWLVREPPFDARLALLLFRPRRHYPSEFGTPLSLKGRAAAGTFEALLLRWRRRSDAHAVLTLDEVAAERWARRPGARAYWLPEPWVEWERPLRPWEQRRGCALFGALTERKGIELLAAAVSTASTPPAVVLAGAADPAYEDRLNEQIARMEAAGAEVEVRPRWLSEEEGLEILGRARCAVMPYQDHFGMSRVLLEAATVGTPVAVHADGLLAHLVRAHRLGLAVDCTDAGALAGALERLTAADAPAARPETLRRFADRYSRPAFERAVGAALIESEPVAGNAGARWSRRYTQSPSEEP
jgi:hypothetical protein